MDSKSVLIFPPALVFDDLLAILDFSPNKNCKTYLGTILPPRIGKVISNLFLLFSIKSSHSQVRMIVI